MSIFTNNKKLSDVLTDRQQWLLIIGIVVFLIAIIQPYRPQFIVTKSVDRGFYIVDTSDDLYKKNRGDYVNFLYQAPASLKDYKKHDGFMFIKRVLGLPGDIMRYKRDDKGNLIAYICEKGKPDKCFRMGKVYKFDSQDESLPQPKLMEYTVPPMTYIVGSDLDKGFDSRYFGPYEIAKMRGGATEIFSLEWLFSYFDKKGEE